MAEKTVPGLYKIPEEFMYDGVVFGRGHSREALGKLKEFPFRQDDTLIVAYSKCGEYITVQYLQTCQLSPFWPQSLLDILNF